MICIYHYNIYILFSSGMSFQDNDPVNDPVSISVINYVQLLRSYKLLDDGLYLFHQPDSHRCFKRVVLFLGNMFKLLGHTQLLEKCAISEEIVLLHDNGFVLLRFTWACN